MKKPVIGKAVFIAQTAVVIGDVELGDQSSIWYGASVRGDRGSIKIGQGSNVQDNCTVHMDEGFPVTIGDYVTIGHNAVVHGCSIGDNTLVGMGAVILNGAEIGANCIIGAGALVTQNAKIPDNSLVMGVPGKIIKSVTEEGAAANRKNAEAYIEEAEIYLQEQM